MSAETPIPEPDASLRELLDEAGRAVQPRHPGWDALAQRLAALSQRRRRRWQFPAAAAVAAAVAAAFFLLSGDGPIPIRDVKAEEIEVVRQDVELTVLSISEHATDTLYMPLVQRLSALMPHLNPMMQGTQGLAWQEMQAGRFPIRRSFEEPVPLPSPPFGSPGGTGQALVKDHRLILNLQKGDNLVRFTEVPATIDPTSVKFYSNTDPTGTQVIEQNFEYDLVSADKLLQKFIDRTVTCIGRDGSETSGFLASADADTIVLADKPTPQSGESVERSTQTVTRASLRALRLPEMPPDLLVKPTLVWKLRVAKPGQHDTTVSYICGSMHWLADYIALVKPGNGVEPDMVDLSGWVSLTNSSGATYPDAGLKLIAGDVNRRRDPWVPIPPVMPMMAAPSGGGGGGGGGPPPIKEFIEKSFFEYHLYTLTAPSTVKHLQTKQLNLLSKRGIKAERKYVFEPQIGSRQVAIELSMKNEKDNNLGMPLPKGRVRLEQKDIDGDTALIGQVQIDHTPTKEELKLRYGYAFDMVGEMKTVEFVQNTPQKQTGRYEIRVRNHKTQPAATRIVFVTGSAGKIIKETRKHTMHDFQTAHYEIVIPSDTEEVLTLTVEYNFDHTPAAP